MIKFTISILITGMCFLAHSSYLLAQAPVKHISILPDCFFEPNLRDSLRDYAIGISDPDLIDSEAYKQAKLRGAAVLAMAKTFTFSKSVESYQSVFNTKAKQEVNKCFARLTCKFDTVGLRIEEKYYSEFDECFLLLSKHERKLKLFDEFKLEAVYYFSSTKSTDYVETGMIGFDIMDSESSKLLLFSKYRVDNRCDIVSKFNEENTYKSDKLYIYPDKISSDYFDSKLLCADLKYSFWSGYLSAIIKAVNVNCLANSKTISMKKEHVKFEQVTRDLSEDKYSFKIQSMSLKNNTLCIKPIINKLGE